MRCYSFTTKQTIIPSYFFFTRSFQVFCWWRWNTYIYPKFLFILFVILSIDYEMPCFLTISDRAFPIHTILHTSYCHVERTLMSFKKCSSRRAAKSGITLITTGPQQFRNDIYSILLLCMYLLQTTSNRQQSVAAEHISVMGKR